MNDQKNYIPVDIQIANIKSKIEHIQYRIDLGIISNPKTLKHKKQEIALLQNQIEELKRQDYPY